MKKYLFAVAAVALLFCTFEASVHAQRSGVRIGPSADDAPSTRNAPRSNGDAKPAAASNNNVPPSAVTASDTKAVNRANAATDAAKTLDAKANSAEKGNAAEKPASETPAVSAASTTPGLNTNSAPMTTDAPAKTSSAPVAPPVAAPLKNNATVDADWPRTRTRDSRAPKTDAANAVMRDASTSPAGGASSANQPLTPNNTATTKTPAPSSVPTVPASSTATSPASNPVNANAGATPNTSAGANTPGNTSTNAGMSASGSANPNAGTNGSAAASDASAGTSSVATSPAAASPVAASPVAATVALPPTETYRVGAGDVLDIRLLNQGTTRESTLFTVIDGGLLEYPLAGAPRVVSGLTTDEIGALLTAELKRRAVYEKPRVMVNVREYVSHTALVSGLVNEPGAKVMRREAMPLYVVLAEAQPKAEAGRALLISRATGQTTVVDLADNNAMNALVYAGDVIQVQPRPREFFYIGGAIALPGQKDFHAGMTLTQAVLASGGVIDPASNRVRVARQGADGRLVSTEYVWKDIDAGKVPDPGLQPGDRIEVVRGKR